MPVMAARLEFRGVEGGARWEARQREWETREARILGLDVSRGGTRTPGPGRPSVLSGRPTRRHLRGGHRGCEFVFLVAMPLEHDPTSTKLRSLAVNPSVDLTRPAGRSVLFHQRFGKKLCLGADGSVWHSL
jgi:hypothetical protein